jgi:hypothetical protein
MLNKKNISAIIFAIFAVWLSTIAPTTSISWMLGILVLTIYLFAFEVVEVDEAAITIMIILGLSSLPWIHTLMGLEEGLSNF